MTYMPLKIPLMLISTIIFFVSILPLIAWNLCKYRGIPVSILSRRIVPSPSGRSWLNWKHVVDKRTKERQPFKAMPIVTKDECLALHNITEELTRMVIQNHIWTWYQHVSVEYTQSTDETPEKASSIRIMEKGLYEKALAIQSRLVPMPPPPPILIFNRDPYVVNMIEQHLRQIVLNFKTRLGKIDLVSFLTTSAVPILTRHISEYKKALMLLNQSGRRHLTRSTDFDLILAGTYRRGRLHMALGGRDTARQRRTSAMQTSPLLQPMDHPAVVSLPTQTTQYEYAYLRQVAEQRLFPVLLPTELQSSRLVVILLREIFVCCILQPIMAMLADPDYWNQTMDQLATKLITEQKMVKQLREALDRPFTKRDEDGINGEESRLFGSAAKSALPTFEEYLNAIKECKSLLDAKRIRNALVTEIRRRRLEIMDKKDKDTVNGRKVEEIKRYIHRLTIAKRRSEKRILQLGGTLYHHLTPRSSSSGLEISTADAIRRGKDLDGWVTGLSELLSEPGLTYFREFVDRTGHSQVLQFWLTIEAVKGQFLDPLQIEESSGDVPPAVAKLFDCDAASAAQIEETLQTDLRMIFESCFSDHSKLHKLKAIENNTYNEIGRHHRLITEKSTDAKPVMDQVVTRRTHLSTLFGLMVRAQYEVFAFMETSLMKPFVKSDLYIKLITDPAFSVDVPVTPVGEKPLSNTLGRSMSYLDSVFKKRFSSSSGEAGPSQRPRSPPLLNRTGAFSRGLSPSKLKSVLSKSLATKSMPSNTDYSSAASDSASLFDGGRKSTEKFLDDLCSANNTSIVGTTEEEDDVEEAGDDDEPDIDLLNSDAVEEFEEALNKIMEDEIRKPDVEIPLNISSSEEEDDDDREIESHDDYSSNRPANVNSSVEVSSHTSNGDEAQTELRQIKQQIDIIKQQEAMLDLMIEKTGSNSQELTLLQKAKWQYQQDLQALLFDKSQLELQTSDSMIVPGQTRIRITSWALGNDQMGPNPNKQFVVFVIEVDARRHAGTGWIVARRYSEFLMLHKKLKSRFPNIMNRVGYELPGKRFFRHFTSTNKLKSTLVNSLGASPISPTVLDRKEQDFMEERRQALERYLEVLCRDAMIAPSLEFRHFLCLEDFTRFVKGSKKSNKPFGLSLSSSSFGKRISSILSSDPSSSSVRSASIHSRRKSFPAVSFLDVLTQKLGGVFNLDEDDEDGDNFEGERTPLSGPQSIRPVSPDRPLLPTPELIVSSPAHSPETIHQRIQEQIAESIETPMHNRPTSASSSEGLFPLSQAMSTASSASSLLKPPKPTLKLSLSQASSISVSASGKFGKSEDQPLNITEPLCDLFIEIFELKEKNNWLRKQAVLIVLQQLFGGAIERRFTESVKSMVTEDMWVWYLERIQESLKFYGDPELQEAYVPRDEDQKHQVKISAFKKLHFLIPDMFGSMVGRANAKRGTTRFFDVLQNRRLNQEWQYRMLDAIVNVLVPKDQIIHED